MFVVRGACEPECLAGENRLEKACVVALPRPQHRQLIRMAEGTFVESQDHNDKVLESSDERRA